MGRASNTVNPSDKSMTPIRLRYTSSYSSSSLSAYGITLVTGINGSVGITGSVPLTTLNYYSVKQLYYSNFLTGSYLSNSSSFDNFLQSTAASGTLDADVRYFPTNSNATVAILSIPRTIFGENIGRKGLIISSSVASYFLSDDGNGNLLDFTTSYPFIHAGNVLYNQGMVILTHPNYVNLTSSFTLTVAAESTIYQNEVRCHVSENDFNYTLNPSVFSSASFSTGSNTSNPIFSPLSTTGSYYYITAGKMINAVTGSSFIPYATTIGLYNEQDELLVVGKLATPYPIPSNTDITFTVRWDS